MTKARLVERAGPLSFPVATPDVIVAIVLIHLAFQFFVHTQAIRKPGWLDYVFNTPSIHRVRHARNDRYIDRNYAGVLVIRDRLFGSYVTRNEQSDSAAAAVSKRDRKCIRIRVRTTQ